MATGAACPEDDWDDDEVPGSPAAVASATLNVSLTGNGLASVSILVPESEDYVRRPNDVCCVIDVSGSMGSEASYEADGVEVTDNRFSILDIVRHAVKTVVHMLQDGDRLAIVTFSDDSKTPCALSYMDSSGKDRATAALEALRPEGATNLWAGLHTGMEALLTPSASRELRAKTLLLLTDGQPNEEPEGGTLAALKTYQESHPSFKFQLNTFGFGSGVDSDLLLQMGEAGNGTYAFIPDAIIVGTVFVNSIANVLSTYTQNSTLHLMAKGGSKLSGLPLGFPRNATTDASWGRVIELGPLQVGQCRDLVFPIDIPDGAKGSTYLDAVLTYSAPDGRECKVSCEAANDSPSLAASFAAKRATVAGGGADAIAAMLADRQDDANAAMEAACAFVQQQETGATTGVEMDIEGLSTDAKGRMSKAISTSERFHRWGKHYLRALVRAHQLQLCTNFMDPGLQSYGGELFKKLRQEGDNIFLSLPPPTPAPDETAIPCDVCGQNISFSNYMAHVDACANRRPAAPAAPARAASPAPTMQTYYAGGGGG